MQRQTGTIFPHKICLTKLAFNNDLAIYEALGINLCAIAVCNRFKFELIGISDIGMSFHLNEKSQRPTGPSTHRPMGEFFLKKSFFVQNFVNLITI